MELNYRLLLREPKQFYLLPAKHTPGLLFDSHQTHQIISLYMTGCESSAVIMVLR